MTNQIIQRKYFLANLSVLALSIVGIFKFTRAKKPSPTNVEDTVGAAPAIALKKEHRAVVQSVDRV